MICDTYFRFGEWHKSTSRSNLISSSFILSNTLLILIETGNKPLLTGFIIVYRDTLCLGISHFCIIRDCWFLPSSLFVLFGTILNP